MKNIFAFISGLLFLVFAIVFFAFLNIKFSFLEPQKVKDLFAETNTNNIVSSYIQESVSSASQIDFSEGNNLEVFNKAFDKQSVNKFIGTTVDKFFVAFHDPQDKNLKFDVKYDIVGENLPVQLAFVKKVNLNENNTFFALIFINKLLIYIGIAALLALMGVFFLGGKSVSSHFLWASSYIFVLVLLLGGIVLAAYKILPNHYSNIIESMKFVQDVKLLVGMKKIVSQFVTNQFSFYYIEIGGLLVLGIASRFFGGLFSREDHEKLDDDNGDPRGYFPPTKKK